MPLGRAPLLFNQKTSRRFLLCSSCELVSLSSDLSSISGHCEKISKQIQRSGEPACLWHNGTKFRRNINTAKKMVRLHRNTFAARPGSVISGALVALTSVLCPQYANYVFRAEADTLFRKRTRSAFQEPFPSGRNPFVLSGKRVIEPLNYLTTAGVLSRGKSCGGTAFQCAKARRGRGKN
jgi:hypothetical protein